MCTCFNIFTFRLSYKKTKKIIQPLHAITKNTPLERVGKLFKKDSVEEEEEEESNEGEEQEYDEEIAINDEQDTVAK